MDEPGSFGAPRPQAAGAPDLMAVFFGVLSLLALWWTVAEVRRNAQARHSSHWSKVSGSILDSRVHVRPGTSRFPSRSYPVIHYAYTVTGHAYQGNRATFDESCDESYARDVVDRYPAGMQVDVFYDPNRPSIAVLEPKTFELYGIGSILFCLLAAATPT
jgi:hypothetical protein